MTKHYREQMFATTAAAPERKDGDPAALSVEVKKAMDDFLKVFEDFKKKNDQAIADAKKGRDDVVTKTELEAINKAVSDAEAKVKQRVDELEAKANRLALGGNGSADVEQKHANQFGEQLGVKNFTIENLREYKDGLGGYLRRNEVKAQTMSVGTDPAGGYWVTPETADHIVKKVYETSPMRQVARVVTIGSDTYEFPIDNGEVDAAWVGEKQDRAQTDAAQFGKGTIAVNELYAYPWVTQKVLEDSKIDIEAWLGEKSRDKFSRKENTSFLTGDGIMKPKGLLTYATAATADATRAWGTFEHIAAGVTTAAAFIALNAAATDKIIDVIYALKAAYRQNARFMASRATVGVLRKLKDGQGNYVWAPGATAGQPSSLMNYPLAEGEDMPAIASNSLSLAFGDFRETYTIVDRTGISVVRDNITKPGFVKYHMRKRVGGGVENTEALKFLKFA